MRQRFDLQLKIGQTPIREINIHPESKNALDQLIVALKEIYCNDEYNNKIFCIMEKYLPNVDPNNGRPGMNLWTIFVLGQVRQCMNYSYDVLQNQANNHRSLRQLLGLEFEFGIEPLYFKYQNIYDNVKLLTDPMLHEINDVIVSFGHKEVFKKKEATPLRLKTDSFVVESNVHFPTDYGLLWDCLRKCLDMIGWFVEKYPHLTGWRKIKNWRFELKSLMRSVGRISGSGGKNKEEKLRKATALYLEKSKLLLSKLFLERNNLPVNNIIELGRFCALDYYMQLLIKHIDLVDRRILKGETIPHSEKMMSIFEDYTEWVAKGKCRPSVEFGKKLSITTDQFDLILFYKIMNEEQDRDIVIEIADNMLYKYKHIFSMSFDKGHWLADNKNLLELEIPLVVLPKLGRLTEKEKEREGSKKFKQLRNQHSAIESNINELEHRGLDRCPDRSYTHYSTYVSMGICAYNLKKIGAKILENQLKASTIQKAA